MKIKFGIITKDDLYLGLDATFMLDFDGNIDEAAVKNALRGISEEAKYLKFLGNY